MSPDEIEPSQPPPVAGHSRKDQNEKQSVTDRTIRRDEARKGNQNRRADELRKGVHNRKDQTPCRRRDPTLRGITNVFATKQNKASLEL